jgi:hypothetical protein
MSYRNNKNDNNDNDDHNHYDIVFITTGATTRQWRVIVITRRTKKSEDEKHNHGDRTIIKSYSWYSMYLQRSRYVSFLRLAIWAGILPDKALEPRSRTWRLLRSFTTSNETVPERPFPSFNEKKMHSVRS